MNWDWITVKEKAHEVYAKVSQLLVFLAVCFYLLACVVAGAPVGPKTYVGFVYHCFQWQPKSRLPYVQERHVFEERTRKSR